jgi:hypothetical protein
MENRSLFPVFLTKLLTCMYVRFGSNEVSLFPFVNFLGSCRHLLSSDLWKRHLVISQEVLSWFLSREQRCLLGKCLFFELE